MSAELIVAPPRLLRRGGPAASLAALLILLTACERKRPAPPAPPPPVPVTRPAPPPASAALKFTRVELTAPQVLSDLEATLGAERFAAFLKFNRKDLQHARKGDSLLVPPEGADWMALSPFPARWPEVADQPKLLVVSLRLQAWAAYEAGTLVRWGPTSSGRKKTPTPVGLYHTNWCQKERASTFNDEWELKWYVNLHNTAGISFHQYELPGYPDSHACLRLAPDDAEWIYRWCASWKLSKDERTVLQKGTPVVVFGEYGWGQAKPWREADVAPDAARLQGKELDEAVRILQEEVPPEVEAVPED
jgi:hypothetical protein